MLAFEFFKCYLIVIEISNYSSGFGIKLSGSPALTVISNAYLNNWSEAEVIQISITYR
jgi:hypothetical protein